MKWYKSSYSSGTGECVEVADLPAGVRAVRDSKNPDGGMLMFAHAQWSAFTAALKSGALD